MLIFINNYFKIQPLKKKFKKPLEKFVPWYVSWYKKKIVRNLWSHLNDKNDRVDVFNARKRLQLHCKKEMTRKKIWLNNLNRLSRDFFFVKGQRDVGGRCKSGPCFDEHLTTLTVDACCFGLIFFMISFLRLYAKDAVDTCWSIER